MFKLVTGLSRKNQFSNEIISNRILPHQVLKNTYKSSKKNPIS